MFNLTIVTPQKKVVENSPALEIVVPAERGELQILEGHSPLLTILNPGKLQYKLKDSEQLKTVAVSWGYCEVFPSGVNIMAETAESPEDIDVKRAEEALSKAEKQLANPEIAPEDVEKYQRKVKRAEIRLDVAKG